MPAGELADKVSKQKVIVWTMIAEIIGMAYGIFAMHFDSVINAYAALFVVALQAALFNPSKYAIIPEIVKRENISKVNGILTLSTYLAIILGTFLASFFTQVTGSNYTLVAVFCFCIAVIGLIMSLQIEKTPVKNPTKKINPLFIVQVFKSLKLASKYPHLLLTVLASSYFVYMASFTQLNLIPLAVQSLGITDVQGGYVFLAAALGIGVGSTIVAVISGKNVELGIAVWGGLGSSLSYIILYFFAKDLLVAVMMIFSLGLFGGLYIVPLDAYIQVASPDKDRGEIVASGSFLGFFGVLLAAISIGFFSDVLKLTAAEGYLVVGMISMGVAVTVLFFLPDYFTRFFAVTFFKAFYHITPKNQPKVDFYDSVLIVSKKYSFAHILSLLQLYHRVTFIRFVKKMPSPLLKPYYRLSHIFPFPVELSEEESKKIYAKICDKKMPFCLFLEGELKFDTQMSYQDAVNKFLELNTQPVIPLGIQKFHRSKSLGTSFNILKSLPVEVSASFGSKEEKHLKLDETAKLIENLEHPA